MMSGPKPPSGYVWTIPAIVDRIIDADSLECHVWLSPTEERHGIDVRVEGINALERSDKFGTEATNHAAAICPPGTPVMLACSKREKYGRMLARVTLPDGTSFGDLMLTALASDGVTPLAVPYLV